MIEYIRKLIMFFFNLVHIYYHQKSIAFYLKNKMNKIDVLFDVGSHMGTYTDLVLRTNPGCKSFLFEPQSKIFEKIDQKYSHDENVNVFNLAISDAEQKQNLNLNKHDLTASLLDFDPKSNYLKFKALLYQTDINNMNYKTELVQTITLEKFIVDNNLEKIDLLKIDTEGFEFDVIKGACNYLKKIKLIYFEHHFDSMIIKNYKFSEIHEYLKNNNFKKILKNKMPFRKTFEYIYENRTD